MRSTKSGLSSSVLVSRTLETVGIVIVLATLLDIGIAAIPYNLNDRLWQIGFTTSLVDRGIVPMVGIVLFLTGFWIDSNSEDNLGRKGLLAKLRVGALALASLLGATYLILFPLHLSNIGWSNQQALERISQKAKQAETELGNQLNTEVNSQRSQINQLLATNDEQLGQLVTSNQLSKEQADLIRKFKADPKTVEPFLNKRIEETKTQLQTRIATEKLEAEKKAKTESLKSGLRIGISSLLLAAGFITIGWTGLRHLGQP
jgi:hypothetical protein